MPYSRLQCIQKAWRNLIVVLIVFLAIHETVAGRLRLHQSAQADSFENRPTKVLAAPVGQSQSGLKFLTLMKVLFICLGVVYTSAYFFLDPKALFKNNSSETFLATNFTTFSLTFATMWGMVGYIHIRQHSLTQKKPSAAQVLALISILAALVLPAFELYGLDLPNYVTFLISLVIIGLVLWAVKDDQNQQDEGGTTTGRPD